MDVHGLPGRRLTLTRGDFAPRPREQGEAGGGGARGGFDVLRPRVLDEGDKGGEGLDQLLLIEVRVERQEHVAEGDAETKAPVRPGLGIGD